MGFGIYIHVPFCGRAKCPYCDFYSLSGKIGKIPAYLDAAGGELEEAAGGLFFSPGPVETIYFGGGTPSLLDPAGIKGLVSKIKKLWPVDRRAEITVECNPENLESGRLAGYRQAGVTRLSCGCQSFDDQVLRQLGRCHSAAKARQALVLAAGAGFKSLSVDLIFGGPGSTVSSLVMSLETALELGADHLSLYGYHLEKGCRGYGKKRYAPAGDEQYRSQYLAACSLLESRGWSHYEISNWAASPEKFCRHNLAYWRREKAYLGIGPSAHSFIPPHLRFWNRADLEKYLETQGKSRSNVRQEERLSEKAILGEQVMLSLRLSSGLEARLVELCLGQRKGPVIRKLNENGLIFVNGSGSIVLSDKGFLVYDSIVELLYSGREFQLDKKKY